jgi:hypothetical protein
VAGISGEFADEVSRCLLEALAGLAFPCLAGTLLCPEQIMIE